MMNYNVLDATASTRLMNKLPFEYQSNRGSNSLSPGM
jgi:hypothetical protein